MSFKHVAFYVGCAAAWFILLPVFVVGGGIALLTYAIFSEVSDSFGGEGAKTLDNSTAREIARRVCIGH
jgi:hypothetical protein